MNYWYLLAAIPVFGVCVLIHELGHFLTAKWADIRVEEFGLGLPPRIVGFRIAGWWRDLPLLSRGRSRATWTPCFRRVQ